MLTHNYYTDFKKRNDMYKILTQVNDKLIYEMIELDKFVFQGENIGSFEKCKEWLSVNADIYTVLLYNNRVIGYINFIPIDDDIYKLFKMGRIADFQITKNDILRFEKGKTFNCLFTSIVIHPDFQTGLPLIKLWLGFIKHIKKFQIHINNVIMDCVTDIGKRCAKNYLKAKKIRKSKHGEIYEGRIIDLV